jgi:phenylalanyl-tRNA synthetase alpha chain
MELPQVQFDVLKHVTAAGRPVAIAELAAALHLDQSPIMGAAVALHDAGLVLIEESAYQDLHLGTEGGQFVNEPLPERVIVGVLGKLGGRAAITDIPQHCGLNAAQVGQSLRWLAQRGWARKEGGELVLAEKTVPTEAGPPPQPDEQVIKALAAGRVATRAELESEGLPVAAAVELLSKRKGFLTIKERTARTIAATDKGRELIAGGAKGRRWVTQLTPELLTDGAWRDVELQPYDVTLAAKKLYPGKEHAFQRTLDRVRRVFLEMGFEEIISPWIESSFWDFDALFQPQDHPARDMQDTFYVARPDRCRLPDDKLVERIRRTHEDGGDTGSTGWQYRWSRDLATRPVLRTHTTAATMRALARHVARWEGGKVGKSQEPEPATPSHLPSLPPSHSRDLRPGRAAPSCPPGKYFIVGPVFRRETADFKHLPVFHQVDGIIVDKHASLATLIGTLSAFYAKMGFPKVKVTPSFFPYTEPSAEVHLYMEARGEWVEMGGSGLFRPEVTLPVGISDRVLAWGLGLERLAMMIHNLSSIGELYFATMPWLREEALSRA